MTLMTPLASPSPLMLLSAPNGARRTSRDHPALPMSAQELALCAAECQDAGAVLLHLHVRDQDGQHILDAEAYQTATAAIRKTVGDRLIIQITTEAVGRYSPEEQIAVVRATRPEAVSLALRELIPQSRYETEAAKLLTELYQQGCMVQYILYAPAEVIWLGDLVRRGIIPDGPLFPLFVVGRYSANQQSDPAEFASFIERWLATQANSALARPWSVCAFGPQETSAALAAICMGGHARVGFENSLWRPDGQLAASPAEPIRRLAEAASLIARPLASVDQARALLMPR